MFTVHVQKLKTTSSGWAQIITHHTHTHRDRKLRLTMKNWQRVIWGKMLCALFLPQDRRDCFQKCVSCWSSGPLGRRYNTYSLGRGSSRKGSSTWEKSLEWPRSRQVERGRKKKAVIMEDKKEGAANVQQRAAMVVNAIWRVNKMLH